jgi:UDP-2,4-diacetamido-2,4,6-trideoxy-beta-L-altropyranose hydrolase
VNDMAVNDRSEVEVRPVEASDSDLLLAWANDPIVRENSLSPQQITKAAHEKWFEETLSSSTRHQYVALLGSQPVGQIRFDAAGEAWEVGVSVAPTMRGLGLGTTIIEAGLRKLKEDEPGAQRVRALIRPTNTASLRAFRRAGFVGNEMSERATHTVLILEQELVT